MAHITKTPLEWLPQGYPKLAGQMGLLPETATFRTFSALNARNLLYMQAELTTLERELLSCELADSNVGKGNKSMYSLDWYWLKHSQSDGDTKQLNLIIAMREKLDQYNNALIQASNLASLQRPDEYDIDTVQRLLMSKELGALALVGDDANTWGSMKDPKGYSPDLVALRARHREDTFSNWMTALAARLLFSCGGCYRLKQPSRIHGVVGLEDSSIHRVTSWITSIIASLFPILSIVILYCVHSMAARLGIIAAFNLLISACLSIFTNAKRIEVFAVTAAFAAIQVVFVQGTVQTDQKSNMS